MIKQNIIKRFLDDSDAEIVQKLGNSITTMPELDNISFLKDDFIRKYAQKAKVSSENIENIIKNAHVLLKDSEMVAFLWFCHSIINEVDHIAALHNIKSLPDLEGKLGDLFPIFFLLLVLAKFPKTIGQYKERDLPEDVLSDSLMDLNIWLEQNIKEYGILGFKQKNIGWPQSYLNLKLFRVGRLQFNIPFKFENYLYALRNKKTKEVVYISASDIRYNSDGFIDGVNDIWDDKHWVSTIERNEKTITGYVINKSGNVSNNKISLDFDEWDLVLAPGDDVLNIHIPAGEPMTIDGCLDSFKRVDAFVAKYYPDYNYKAIVCFSWLLDPQYTKLLKPQSNIIKFQELGQIFPIAGTSDAIGRVFGPEAVANGVNAVEHISSMQRSLAEFINSGGVLRNGGFIRL